MKNNKYYDVLLKKILNETLEDKANEVMGKLKFNKPGSSFDYVEGEMCESCGGEMREGEMCESCGGGMREGEMCESCGGEMREGKMCESCGYMKGGEVLEIDQDKFEIGKRYKYNPKKFNNQDKGREMTYNGRTNYSQGGSQHNIFQDDKFGMLLPDEELDNFDDLDIEELAERLIGKQKNIDKNRNRKIDGEDFKMLRKKKETKENRGECMECGGKSYMEEDETAEGNSFTDKLRHTPKGGKFKLGNKEYTDNSSLEEEVLYKLQSNDDSELFTESEIIDLIERIIMEEKDNIKKGKTPAGLAAYEKAHKGSGKENNNYMKEFTKKITDYNKDGSKEKFTTDPKHFPKGNGELEKMEKMAYEVSKDGDEFIDDYLRPGMQILDYDEMHPNEDWMDDNIEGSSKTGNNNKWANSEETEINKNINKTRKKGAYNKAKRAAYNKAPQPIISDKPGQESGKGLKLKNESLDEKSQMKLNEEFNRMKTLMGYKEKTQ